MLFDFGGVVTTSLFEAFGHYEARQGLPDGLIRKINSTNPDSNAWARLERSEVGIEAFVEAFEAEAADMGHTVSGHDVLGCLSGELRPEMVEAIDRLAAGGFRLALLTNNFLPSNDEAPRDGPASAMRNVIDHFEVVVESSTAGCRKPDRRFYEIALERLGIEANEAVFLDDLGVNLKPARAMGMTTIKVLNAAQALEDLEQVVGIDLLGPA